MNCEEHLILRFPDDWIRSLNSDSKIEFIPYETDGEDPGRFFRVKFGSIETFSVLLDLPCIIETHKSLDYINFFKNSDICQMMYVIPEHEKQNPRAKSKI
jgi:TATA-binding protein-associated factor